MASRAYLPFTTATTDKNDLIKSYFQLGFNYLDIVSFLVLYHNTNISLRQVKRILKKLNLSRRRHKDDIQVITELVERELCGTGRDLGYRSMHEKLLKIHHAVTDRETVRLILQHLDPDGVQFRRQRRLRRRTYRVPGPNYLWHIDGWDKLKAYGFCIHGCIDGYARQIIWLEAAATNNDPYVVCRYFADRVKELQAVPKIVRADHGTENVNVELMQRFLRSAHEDNRALLDTTFLYGKSTANQRIESWWSRIRQNGMNTWISHFKEMTDTGIIDLQMTWTSSVADFVTCTYSAQNCGI